MPPSETRPLTKRQAAVMERIDRRVPIKVIAQELGVSETRINQHIRALKDIYSAHSLRDLVDLYRLGKREKTETAKADAPRKVTTNELLEPFSKPLSEAVYTNSQVPEAMFGFDTHGRDSITTVELNDAMPLIESAPWLKQGEPKVVPGLLDGEHAVIARFAAIVGIAFGLLAAGVLTATAALMISNALEGRASVPVDEHGFS